METAIPGLALMFCGIILAFEVIIVCLLLRLMVDVKRLKIQLHNHIRECDRRFYALAKDFKQHSSKA